jgi:hypothetical protein
MSVVALWSPSDHLLSVLAPLALAVSRRPSLVIDLDEAGPHYQSPFTLADLVRNGPTETQLRPVPGGPHVLANGGVPMADVHDVVAALIRRWPDVVLRCPPSMRPPDAAVRIVPLLPEPFAGLHRGRRVCFQDLGLGVDAPAGERVLPRPSQATLRSLVGLRAPLRSRWVRSLQSLWGAA